MAALSELNRASFFESVNPPDQIKVVRFHLRILTYSVLARH